jgi:outer membrane biosynthesis protein TonB
MTDQLILGIAVLVVALIIIYELIETWRWRGFRNRPPSRFRLVRWLRRAFGGAIAVVTFRRSSGRQVSPEPTMTAADLGRRLGDPTIGADGAGPVHLRPGRIVVSGSGMPAPRSIQPVTPLPPPRGARPSRGRLIRDTAGAALVIGGILVAAANLISSPQGKVEGVTATPAPTPVTVTSASPSGSPLSIVTGTPGPGATAGLDPTPAPALVSSTPTPRPRPTARPTAQPQPTSAPTSAPKPTAKRTPRPTPKPTPAPPVISNLAATPGQIQIGQTVLVSFDYANATSFTINFGDGAGTLEFTLSGSEPAAVSSQPYQDPGTVNVVVVVSGSGGSNFYSVPVIVSAP